MSEEKRIYVVVAETVDTDRGVVIQPCGRIAAQCAHVVSKMRCWQLQDRAERWSPVTTIVLAAPDSAEMGRLALHFLKLGPDFTFMDSNEEVYGPDCQVLTALCTIPLTAEQIGDTLAHLPLWSHDPATRVFLPPNELYLV